MSDLERAIPVIQLVAKLEQALEARDNEAWWTMLGSLGLLLSAALTIFLARLILL